MDKKRVKKYFCNELPIGSRITEVFFVSNYAEVVLDEEVKKVRFSLSDAKGRCESEIEFDKLQYDLDAYINSIVCIEGFVSFIRGNPYIRLRSIDIIDPNLVEREELLASIAPEEKKAAIDCIRMVIANLKNENYKKICEYAFSEDVLNELAYLPYNLQGACNYMGASLVVTHNLLRMAGNCAAIYNGFRPSIYSGTDEIDYDLLYAAILLSISAKTAEFKGFPFRRTSISVFEGKFELVWQTIVHYSVLLDIDTTGTDIQYLCSVLKDLFVSETSPVLKEGHLLKKLLSMYMELSNYDACLDRFVSKGSLDEEGIGYKRGIGYIHKKKGEFQ